MKDKCLKTYTIIGVFFVLAAGSLAHFLYDWTGSNAIAGLFVPVNESVWEHMKLLFFPMHRFRLMPWNHSRNLADPCFLLRLYLHPWQKHLPFGHWHLCPKHRHRVPAGLPAGRLL